MKGLLRKLPVLPAKDLRFIAPYRGLQYQHGRRRLMLLKLVDSNNGPRGRRPPAACYSQPRYHQTMADTHRKTGLELQGEHPHVQCSASQKKKQNPCLSGLHSLSDHHVRTIELIPAAKRADDPVSSSARRFDRIRSCTEVKARRRQHRLSS
jgi:hypothetical protein